MVQWSRKFLDAFQLGKSLEQPKDALRTELWPVSLGLRLIGAMPIYKSRRSGNHVFRVASPDLALSVLVYLTLMVALSFVHGPNFGKLREGSFAKSILVVLKMFYDVLIVVTPWFYWMEARALARHLSEWTQLQVDFEQVTRTQLHLGLRRRATILACVVCLGSALLETWYMLQKVGPFDPVEMATSTFQDILRGLLCARWYLQCMAIVAVSRQALERLKTDIVETQGSRVLEYRLLWLRLSAQTRDLGTTCCYTHGFFLGYLLVTLMLAVYQTVTCAHALHENSVELVESFIIAGCLFVFCDSAHRATAHVGDRWVAFLLRVRASPSLDLSGQMGGFLEICTAHPPVITLGDYVVVNRALLVSMLSAMITYLVILVQFKMASSGDVNNHRFNETALY